MLRHLGSLPTLTFLVLAAACSLRSTPLTLNHRGGPLGARAVAEVHLVTPGIPHPFVVGETTTGTCNGFYVAQHVIMTAAHCLRHTSHTTYQARVGGDAELTVLWIDDVADIGLARTPVASDIFLLGATEPLSMDDSVWIYSQWDRDPKAVTVVQTTVVSPSTHRTSRLMIGHALEFGQSGSAIVDQYGRVVSVATQTSNAYGYGSPVDAVLRAIERARVS